MNYFYHDIFGLIHLIASILALIFGTLVLVLKKGTKKHKLYGYLYVITMLIVLATAFKIYRLFNGFGLFHYAAIFSGLNLGIGMLSIWLKKPKSNWKFLHLNFMYWSVISLYMAFASEIFTRVPNIPFFTTVYIASFIVFVCGLLGYRKKLKKWKKLFNI